MIPMLSLSPSISSYLLYVFSVPGTVLCYIYIYIILSTLPKPYVVVSASCLSYRLRNGGKEMNSNLQSLHSERVGARINVCRLTRSLKSCGLRQIIEFQLCYSCPQDKWDDRLHYRSKWSDEDTTSERLGDLSIWWPSDTWLRQGWC